MRTFHPLHPRFVLAIVAGLVLAHPIEARSRSAMRYEAEMDRIEVMFAADSRVRLRGGELVDLAAPDPARAAVVGLDAALRSVSSHEWSRLTHLPEEEVDALHARAVVNGAVDLYDLNNVFRLRIADGDVWGVAEELEALPGVLSARPVPLPIELPTPPPFEQEYRAPAAWTPTGTGSDYMAAAYLFGDGTGVRVCDLEYAWNYGHADISQGPGSQINSDVATPSGITDDHGTAVIGMLSADDNGWGVTGLCPGAELLTCGTYFGNPPSWNVAGAILVAVSHLPPGGVILLEQQWNYNDPTHSGSEHVPIEWWTDTYPDPQSYNAVYAAIALATANRNYVVEAGGNGGVDTDALTWFGDSGAIIVGAGGAYPGGPLGGDDLERLAFSSHGSRFDVQGWGENVITTGYGDLHSEGATNAFDYTAIFAGTSSASAHVAAAIASYAAYTTPSFGVVDPAVMRTRLKTHGTPQAFGPSGNIGPRPDLMRTFLAHAPWPLSEGGEYGDAPDMAMAYTDNGVVGMFPTVFATGPSDFIFLTRQPTPLLHLGDDIDYEYEGNDGVPFLTFFDYDRDECFDTSPGDDGLLMPPAYTIQAGVTVPCGQQTGAIGPTCGQAQWGTNFDLDVVNDRGVDGFLNVIFDWNRDGTWGGAATGSCGPVPEWGVQNLVVPSTGSAPLPVSLLVPGAPPIPIGPHEGHVWMRVTLTDFPIGVPDWDGSSASFCCAATGETEDYLVLVGATSDVAGGGPAGDPEPAAAYPNPFRAATTVRFQLPDAGSVEIEVFDVQGRLTRRLLSSRLDAGEHRIAWDGRADSGRRAPSGLYLCTVRTERTEEVVKLYLSR